VGGCGVGGGGGGGGGGGLFAQTIRVSSHEGGGSWPDRHITFIVVEKV